MTEQDLIKEWQENMRMPLRHKLVIAFCLAMFFVWMVAVAPPWPRLEAATQFPTLNERVGTLELKVKMLEQKCPL
jgi:hypothetical protein